jgi:TrbM.
MKSNRKSVFRGLAAALIVSAFALASIAPAVAEVPVVKQPVGGGGAGSGGSSGGNANACGAVLCLAGAMTGNMPGSCKQYVDPYFAIVSFHHGDFSPSRTAQSRMNFLNQCSSSDSNTRSSINSKYGSQQGGI